MPHSTAEPHRPATTPRGGQSSRLTYSIGSDAQAIDARKIQVEDDGVHRVRIEERNCLKPVPGIVKAWLDRPKRQRRAADALDFYRWLLEHEPDLIPRGPGLYHHVSKLIEPHIVKPKP